MRYPMVVLSALSAMTSFFAFSAPAPARPVVMELFTSQGCSSCPPADLVLHALSQEDNVIALSRPVDYWDRLGWKDTLARPENTDRQYAYNDRFRRNGVYTPQLVIDGVEETIGSSERDIRARLAHRKTMPTQVSVAPNFDSQGNLVIALSSSIAANKAQVRLLAVKNGADVAIRRGENGGRKIHYTNIVLDDRAVGVWQNQTQRVMVPAALLRSMPADQYVVLIQDSQPGPILGAAKITPVASKSS